MSIGNLTKKKANRVIGIDASTNSIAFAIFDNGKPIRCGEIMLQGSTVFERLKDAQEKTRALVKSGVLKGDYVAVESAIMVRNIQTAIDLAYVYGAIIGELMESNPEVHKIAPISWQSGIGNPNLKAAEKAALQKANPGKSKTWYQTEGRKMRKARTLAIAKQHFTIPGDSDNIGDAVGIALFCSEKIIRP